MRADYRTDELRRMLGNLQDRGIASDGGCAPPPAGMIKPAGS